MQSVGDKQKEDEDEGLYNRKGGANVGYQKRENIIYERR